MASLSDATAGSPSSSRRLPSRHTTPATAASGTPLPRLGTGPIRHKRQQKLELWSAVALQRHFIESGGARALASSVAAQQRPVRGSAVDASTASAAASSAGREGGPSPRSALPPTITARAPDGAARRPGAAPRLTLAQKMRLVPLPAAQPTAGDWHATETMALLRAQQEYEDERARRHRDKSTALVPPERCGASGGALWPAGPYTSTLPFGSQVCAICQDSLGAASAQGQVILSCSHVFHENCFRQFERLVRLQQREEMRYTDPAAAAGGVGAVMTRLACPQCRCTDYAKKTFFAGKALVQRTALVRIQSVVRGFLARRAYRRMRLRANASYRDCFVEERLGRLSRAWEGFLHQQERDREALLLWVDVRKQEAAAAFLTEQDWQQLIARTCGAQTGGDGARHTCPICLETVQPGLRASQALWAGSRSGRAVEGSETSATKDGDAADGEGVADSATCGTGDEDNAAADGEGCIGAAAVARMRQQYEQKREESLRKTKASTRLDGAAQPSSLRASQRHQRGAGQRSRKPSQATSTRTGAAVPSALDLPKPKEAASALTHSVPPSAQAANNAAISLEQVAAKPRPRHGVVVSCCGHVFHDACLAAFERYSQACSGQASVEGGVGASSVAVPRRCPLCRGGYGKHVY